MIHPIYNSAVFILRCARVGHGGLYENDLPFLLYSI